MPKLIIDEFTYRPISAQRRWQLRNMASGLCRICGEVADSDNRQYCKRHYTVAKNYSRKEPLPVPPPPPPGPQRFRTVCAVSVADIL